MYYKRIRLKRNEDITIMEKTNITNNKHKETKQRRVKEWNQRGKGKYNSSQGEKSKLYR